MVKLTAGEVFPESKEYVCVLFVEPRGLERRRYRFELEGTILLRMERGERVGRVGSGWIASPVYEYHTGASLRI